MKAKRHEAKKMLSRIDPAIQTFMGKVDLIREEFLEAMLVAGRELCGEVQRIEGEEIVRRLGEGPAAEAALMDCAERVAQFSLRAIKTATQHCFENFGKEPVQ